MAYSRENDKERQASFFENRTELNLQLNFIKELLGGQAPQKYCAYYLYLLEKYTSFVKLNEFIQSLRQYPDPQKKFDEIMENDAGYQEYQEQNKELVELLKGQ